MKLRGTSLLFAMVSAGLLLAGCGSDGEPPQAPGAPARIISPADNSTVTTFAFDVVIETDRATVPRATLNGIELVLSGEPPRFTARVQPGPPLRDDNTLAVFTGPSSTAPSIVSHFRYAPPKAVARRITNEADLLRGPLAHGRPGDYLLANTVARFVIQDVGQRDLYSVGTFGGNIIDAELLAKPGNDNFLEIQPALNVETVINAQTVEIVNDGQDGTPAIVRTCGPDDVLDFVNPSTIIRGAGLTFPDSADDKDYDIEACTDYILEPGKPYVQMVTTVFNNEDRDLGLYVGDYVNGSGELEQWTSSNAGLGEILTANLGALAYIGYGEAQGVSYGVVPMPIPGSPEARSSFFSVSGVSYVMQSQSIIRVIFGENPNFVVPARGSRSYSRFFVVGAGSGGDVVSAETEVKGVSTGTLRGCVRAGGQALAGSRVSVLRGRGVVAPFVTGPDGCFRGELPEGSYQVAAARRGYMYEGNSASPVFHNVSIRAGETTELDIDLPATGRLRVEARELSANGDSASAPVPARVTVVGFDPSPEPVITLDSIAGQVRTGTFFDIGFDPVPFGIVWLEYAGADGTVEFEVEPGRYQVFVSRGPEYSLFEQPIEIRAGETTLVHAELVRVVDTTGFISSDYHVHTIHSADSRVNLTDRALQFAGEGVDNVIVTDHHAHTDLMPVIERLGLQRFVRSTIGEEITTWDYGHFNAYPLKIDPTRPSRGSTDWAREAPPGRDFPQYGSFSVSPADLYELAVHGPTSTPDTTIQINHIDSFFSPLRIDTSLVPPQTFLTPEQRLAFRLDPNGGNLFFHYPALELWNGAGRSHQAQFLQQRIGIWMNHLNQGLRTTFIADTDTHEFRNLNTAGARTWTPSSSDDPAEVDPAEVARAVVAGKAVGGQGPYVQARLRAADGSGAVADFTLSGTTDVQSTNGAVDLEIHVQAPLWAEYDKIEIYANAPTTPALRVDGVPTLFSAVPARTLQLGTDFTRERVTIRSDVANASRWETRLSVPFRDLTEDTWFVVVVKGTDGVSRPMFPVFARDLRTESNQTLADLLDGNLGELGTMALAATNALYADVDGTPGFQAPLAPR
ncbi:MAG: hypothetical protein KatS3mg077_1081 [Candidatus Binatia bacterium]|nr:MAG: hypothetical protein KatS3mg077_1081 [Candidatus Binatia bacterium]